ncbi:MAG: helix-turn-helix domain-containing protein [Gammaproteobacteria bacterium]
MPIRRVIQVSDAERERLSVFVHRGKANARTLVRAQILLKLAAGWSDRTIVEAFDVSANTIGNVRTRYLAGGLDAVLTDQRQERRRAALTGPQLAHLVAIACTPAPEGHDHWTLRLLAGRLVELGYVPAIAPETIRQALKKTS